MNIKLLVITALLLAGTLLLGSGCKKNETEYTKVKIISFSVSQIPFVQPDGSSWEDFPLIELGPDVYWLLTDMEDSVYYGSRNLRFDNVTKEHFPLVRVLSTPLVLSPLEASWYVKIYDYDLIGGDDLMATLGPFNFKGFKDHHTSIKLSGDSAVVIMEVEWLEK